MTVRVSVVVPTYRRPDLLGACLACLLAQDFPPDDYEIIVVDDAASEATRQQVEAVASDQWSVISRGGQPSALGGRCDVRAGGRLSAPTRGRRVVSLQRSFTVEIRREGTTGVGNQPVDALPVRAGLAESHATGDAVAGSSVTVVVNRPLPGNGHDRSNGSGVNGNATGDKGANRHGPLDGKGTVRRPAIRYIAVTGPHSPAIARNLGWRAAQGEIIAFTDDDCLPVPGWLAAGAARFADPHVLGVSGLTEMRLPERPTDYELNAAGLANSEFITANCFYRRSALVDAGGFDERFTAAWREDSDLYFTLLDHTGLRDRRRAESRFVYEPAARVRHPVRPAPWGVSIRQQQRNLFNALLWKKHSRYYRGRLAPVTPWHYYVITGSLLAAIAAALAGSRRAAGLWALEWLILTARFIVRRLQGTSHVPGHVVEMAVTSAVIPPVALYWRLRGSITYRTRFL